LEIFGGNESFAFGVINAKEARFADDTAFIGIPNGTTGAEFFIIKSIGCYLGISVRELGAYNEYLALSTYQDNR
jgi:hypothetical protein